MVGWLDMTEKAAAHRMERTRLLGLPLLRLPLPAGIGPWRLGWNLRALRRSGVYRVLLPPDFAAQSALERAGLSPISPLPLCRALAAELALTFLEERPPRQRVLTLRGSSSDTALLSSLSQALCPQVGTLLLDQESGFAALSEQLRRRCGAAVLHPEQGPTPDLVLELSPGPPVSCPCIRLWGTPELAGLTLSPQGLSLPPSVDSLPLMELLWETDRLKIGQILVQRSPSP